MCTMMMMGKLWNNANKNMHQLKPEKKTQNTYSLPDSALPSSTGSNRLMSSLRRPPDGKQQWLYTAIARYLWRVASFAFPYAFICFCKFYDALLMVRKKSRCGKHLGKEWKKLKHTSNTQMLMTPLSNTPESALPDGKTNIQLNHTSIFTETTEINKDNNYEYEAHSTQLRMSRICTKYDGEKCAAIFLPRACSGEWLR